MRSMPGRSTLLALSIVCIFVLTACCSNSTPVLRFITISPATASIDAGATQQFTASAYYSDGTIQDQTSVVGWSSSSPTVATITPGGLATGLVNGTTTITASAVGAQATATLTVSRTLQSIAISPANVTVPLGGSQQYQAIGTFLNQNGSTTTQDLSQLATWNSTNANIPITSGTGGGLATAPTTGTGFTNITATFDGVTSNTAILTLGTLAVTGIQVTPAADTIAVGNTVALTALEVLSNNTTQPVSNPVTWAISNCAPTGAATIADNGVNGLQIVVGVTATTTPCTITATEGTFTQTSTITVVTGSAHFAYVANNNDSSISQYSVTASSATPLVPLSPNPTVSLYQPAGAVVHPSGKFVYAVDAGSGVHLYTVASGALTEDTTGQVVAGHNGANAIVIDPTGRYLYVTDDGTASTPATLGTIDGFTIDQTTGHLTPITALVDYTTNLNAPTAIVIDQTGAYAFVMNAGTTSSVSAYAIQPDGSFQTASVSAASTVNGPITSAIDPTNTYLYVPNFGDQTVTVFTFAGGTLTQVGTTPTTITGATSLSDVAVSPNGKYLYVLDAGDGANPGSVYAFQLNADGSIGSATTTGALVTAGLSPYALAIDPSGTLVAVTNSFSPTASAISLFSASAATGGLSPKTPPTVGSGTGSQPVPDSLTIVFSNAP